MCDYLYSSLLSVLMITQNMLSLNVIKLANSTQSMIVALIETLLSPFHLAQDLNHEDLVNNQDCKILNLSFIRVLVNCFR